LLPLQFFKNIKNKTTPSLSKAENDTSCRFCCTSYYFTNNHYLFFFVFFHSNPSPSNPKKLLIFPTPPTTLLKKDPISELSFPMGVPNANGSWPSSSSSAMGKGEEEQQPLPPSQDPPRNAECRCRCSRIRKFVGARCIIVLLLSVALFLSAAFWLPPFMSLADRRNLHGGSRFKGGVLWLAALFRGVRSVSAFGFGGNEVLGFPDLGACWRNAGERNLILALG